MVDLARRVVMTAAFAMGAVATPRAIVEPPPVPVDDPALSAVKALRCARVDAARAYDKLDVAITAVREAGARLLPRVELGSFHELKDGERVITPIFAVSHEEIDAHYEITAYHAEHFFSRKAREDRLAAIAGKHAELDAAAERLRPIHEATGYHTAQILADECSTRSDEAFTEAMTTEPKSSAGAYALWQLLAEELREYPDEGSSIFEGMDILDKALRALLGVDEPKFHDA